MSKLQKINNTTATHPYLRDSVVRPYYRLRNVVKYETGGMDVLKYVQLSKPKSYVDGNANISYRSRLKCGDALVLEASPSFDIPTIVVSREEIGRFLYYRVWILLENQSGDFGQMLEIHDVLTGQLYKGYMVDFTELAEYCDWRRIPYAGVGQFTQMLEYHFTEGLSYEEAMLYLYSKSPTFHSIRDARKPPHLRVLGLNDRGSAVRNIQEKLRQIGLLQYCHINGVLDKACQDVIKYIQDKYELDADGLIGPDTRDLIYRLTEH